MRAVVVILVGVVVMRVRCDAMRWPEMGGGFVYFGRLVAGLATDLHSGGEEGDARKD
jgi:hypothetical protein